MSAKLKVAIFDLTGCEGCQFHLLSLNEYLMDFWQEWDIVNWRLMSEQDKTKTDFDIAIVEGAATTDEHIKLLREIRASSHTVIAIGSCATNGNFFAQLTPEQRWQLAPKIYNKDYKLKAKFLEPIEKFIKVDHKIEGCPANIENFKKLLSQLKDKQITSAKKQVTIPDYTTKIEGHGTLNINFSQKKASFTVEESERLVEGLVVGKSFAQVPVITARICGICPISHNLSSWTAIENALSIKLSEEAILLRKILTCGQIVKSHILHLFFLVLPDYAGVKGGVELAKKYPAEFHLMLNIKRIADKALTIVGGSDAFPTNTALGGFIKPPKLDDLNILVNDLNEVLDEAQDIIKLFASINMPELKVDTKLSTVTCKDFYPYYPGEFNQEVKEIVQSKSTAKLAVLPDNTVIKTGALARLANHASKLNPQAKKEFNKAKVSFDNPYHNNLAQAIEIMHFLEEIKIMVNGLEKMDIKKSQAQNFQAPKSKVTGQSSLEAPRGILIHKVIIDPEGKIVDYNIIPPTQINLASLEKETQILIKKFSNEPEEEIKKKIQELIRAFDPCITCAVH